MGIPANIVIMWSGAIIDIPDGWFLCNGENGTPDLRNRFVVGTGNNFVFNSQGGTADSIVVSHSHTAVVSTTASHTHTLSLGSFQSGGSGLGLRSSDDATRGARSTTGASDGNHSHSSTINTTGQSGIGRNMPPYLALAYIIYGGD